jgi:hypothetical protein
MQWLFYFLQNKPNTMYFLCAVYTWQTVYFSVQKSSDNLPIKFAAFLMIAPTVSLSHQPKKKKKNKRISHLLDTS